MTAAEFPVKSRDPDQEDREARLSAYIRAMPGRHCAQCGGAAFDYSNGRYSTLAGERGYRCRNCGTVKPE